MNFNAFQKIPRFSREIVITEKIDGTNAQIYIGEDGEFLVGSRTQWITPENDNFGFARWAYEMKEDLLLLGVGSHFGEWWGKGIQRGYGLNEKRFSLFNTSLWTDKNCPSCCDVVPELYRGEFETSAITYALHALASLGSQAAPGFMNPEGVIIFHTAGNLMFKKTIKKDEEHKGHEATRFTRAAQEVLASDATS
jgi:RNA ligase